MARAKKSSSQLTVASVNVNGLRAAIKNGMASWMAERSPDVVTMQEVRAPDDIVHGLVEEAAGAPWNVVHHECASKGRAGVAVATHHAIGRSSHGLARSSKYDDTGRWIEADLETPDGRGLTIVSSYVHTGDAESPQRMSEKLAFLAASTKRLEALRAEGRHVLLTGDLNVAHREADLKNWKGNLTSAGFLPEERAWFDDLFDRRGWVDVVRSVHGDVTGPYSWWSWRGKAFDNDAGWRIDYHIATPELAAMATAAAVDRAPTYATRWSDHAPVVVTYSF